MEVPEFATAEEIVKAQGLPWDSLSDYQKDELEQKLFDVYVKTYGKLPPQRLVNIDKRAEPPN